MYKRVIYQFLSYITQRNVSVNVETGTNTFSIFYEHIKNFNNSSQNFRSNLLKIFIKIDLIFYSEQMQKVTPYLS